jgi:hypothetical protein
MTLYLIVMIIWPLLLIAIHAKLTIPLVKVDKQYYLRLGVAGTEGLFGIDFNDIRSHISRKGNKDAQQ